MSQNQNQQMLPNEWLAALLAEFLTTEPQCNL